MIRSLLFAFVTLLALPGHAKDFRALAESMTYAEIQAVGRLDIGNNGFCTATLVSADLVLTAAHCLYDRYTDKRIHLSEFRFHAGLKRGTAASVLRVKRAAIHPNYNRSKKADLRNMRYDVALLRLSKPVDLYNVSSLGISSPQLGRDVGVVSYARDRAESALAEGACVMRPRPEGIYVTTCSAGYGTSGAPVVQMQQGLPRVVSVVSAMAKADGEPVSLAVNISNILSDLTLAIGS